MKCFYKTLLFCVLPYTIVTAQINGLKFERITSDEGLVDKYAEFIFRDSRDFIWINSPKGLQVFDGLGVQVFRKSSKGKSSISSPFIQGNFFEDSNGHIWFGTYGGLDRFDPIHEVATTFVGKDTSDYHIFHLQNDSLIWLQANKGIYTYDIKQDTFYYKASTTSKRFCVNTSDGQPTKIIGMPWFDGSGVEIYEIDKDLKVNPVKQDLPDKGFFNSGLFINEKEAWLVSNSGLYFYDLDEGILDHCTLPSQFKSTNYTRLFQVNDSLLLFGEMSSGLWEFNTRNKQLVHKSKFDLNQKSVHDLSSNSVSGIYLDRADLLWIGYSQYPAVDFAWMRNNEFQNILDGENANVRSLVQDPNQMIWVGTANKGLYKIDPTDNSFIRDQKFGSTIDQVFLDKSGQLFLITGSKVYQHDFRSQSWNLFYDFGDLRLTRIADGLRGEKYFCTTGGIYKLSESVLTNQVIKEAVDTTFKNGYFLFQPFDSLLLFPSPGIGRIKILSLQATGEIISYQKEIGADIADIIYDQKRKYYWLATNEGLFTSTDLDSLRPVKTDFFNPSNVVSLSFDQQNDLWLSGVDRLWKYQPEEENFWAFSRADELGLESFSTKTSLLSPKGNYLWGGANGLVSFKANDIRPFPKPPSIYLKELTINGEPLNTDAHPLSPASKLSLSYRENTLQFNFKMPTHYLSKNASMYYRLSGKDQAWNRKPNDGLPLNLEKLAPGDYTLEIYGRNANGLRGSTSKFYFLIKKPIWQRAWFIGLVILGIGAITYLLYWNEIRKYKLKQKAKDDQRKRRQKEIDDERNRIQGELHDDLGGTLSKIRYLSDPILLGEMSDEIREALEEIMLEAIDGTDNMYNLIWALRPENNTVNSLVEELQKVIYDFSLERSIEAIIDVPKKDLSLPIGSIKRRNLFLIVKESLNNIRKYAGATQITFSLKMLDSNKKLELIIHDNGSGIPEEKLQNKSGNGIRNIHSRVKTMGGMCKFTNESGTKIWVMIPIK